MSRKARIKGRKFTVILDKDEAGGYSVQCVELPAAISQGDTKKEALKNIREAIREKIRGLEVVSVRDMPVQEAKKAILAYLKSNPGSHFASEIADELGIDYRITFKVVSELLGSGKIRRSRAQ